MIKKTILVTGGTGFVGSHFLNEYHSKYKIIASYRGSKPADLAGVEWLKLDLISEPDFLAASKKLSALKIYAIVHIGGSSPNRAYADGHFHATLDGTINLLKLAKTLRVQRFIYISSLSATVDYDGPYKISKITAEALVKQSNLDYVILRPTNIIGPRAPDFLRVVNLLRRTSIFPLIDSGSSHYQPIYVGDLTQIIDRCLSTSKYLSHTYPLVGPNCLTQKDFVLLCAKLINRRVLTIPIPLFLLLPISHLSQHLFPRLGLNPERLHLQSQDVCLDHSLLEKTFDLKLRSLSYAIKSTIY